MKIETLKDRIAKAEEKISKKQNTITKKTALIEKKKASISKAVDANERYWITCDINHLEEDIMRLEREIKETEESIAGYKAQLTAEMEKAASRNVPAIVEFLEGWKARVFTFYNDCLVPCYEMKAQVKALGREVKNCRYFTPEYDAAYAKYQAVWKEYNNKTCGYFERVKFINKYGREDEKSVKVQDGEWEYLRPYDCCDSYEQATAKLNADLTQEANRKYDFIIERVNAICGTITDATGLKVGAKGDLNGYIIGEKGTAHVQTIGAGGYNIQCFHFRTLIHKAK